MTASRTFRMVGVVLVRVLLVGLIIALILANWMPAIYRSEWFAERFPELVGAP